MINKIKLQIRSQPFHIFLPCHISSSSSVAFKTEVFCVLWRQKKSWGTKSANFGWIFASVPSTYRMRLEKTGTERRGKKSNFFFLVSLRGWRKRSFAMVQSLEIRFAFCIRLTNNDNFLADKRADGGKVLEDNVWEKKKKKQWDN